MALTREQERAKLAHAQVRAIAQKDAKAQQKYRTITRKAQALIRTAGLCQALHFIDSKDDYKALNAHLQDHLAKHMGLQGDILDRARACELSDYLAVTREVLSCLTWQCRMVDALLDDGEEN